MSEARFSGTERYVATEDLSLAVNAAVILQRPLLIKGEPGTGKTQLAQEDRALARAAAARVAHQVHQQGAAGPVRIRCGLAPARFAARRRARSRHPQLHRQGQALGGLRARAAARGADRRDRQGRHRIPERSAARARPHGVLRLRDAASWCAPGTVRSSSSPATTRRSCRTRSCGAASFTTSASRTRPRCAASSTCTSRD